MIQNAMHMQTCTKEKLYICYTRSSEHQLRKPTTQKAHKQLAPRAEAKGLDTTGKRAKEQKAHKLPPKDMH
jgi:hypothetical protein